MRINISLGGSIIYLAIGLVIEILVYPGNPDFHLAFTWVFMVLWPLFLIWWFIYWMLIITLCVVIVAAIWVAGYRYNLWGNGRHW